MNPPKISGLTSHGSIPQVPVAHLIGHEGAVQVVRFTSKGNYCLTGGHDRTVRLWNPFRLDPAHLGVEEKWKTEKRGPPLVAGDPRLHQALPIQTYSSGLTHDISALEAIESSNAQLLLVGSHKTFVISDLVTNQVRRRLHGHSGRINAVAASDRGEAWISGSYDGTVCIWDGRASRDTKPIQVLKDAKDSVTDVHVESSSSKNQTVIRTSSVDGVVRTYDLRMGILKCDDCGSAITSMVPTRDGQCLAISCLDGTIRLMELETGELLNTYHGSHTAGHYGLDVAVLADDGTIASGSEDGNCVLYDVVSADCVKSLSASSNQRPTCSIAAHPSQASVVITASYDGHATVWANNASTWDSQREHVE